MKILFFVLLSASCFLSAGERTLDLSKVKCKFTFHTNEKNAPMPEGSKMEVTGNGIEMTYHFPSSGHDGCMAEFPVNIPGFTRIKVEFTAFDTGHRPYIVFTDRNNEKHYFALLHHKAFSHQKIKRKGRQGKWIDIPVKNNHPGELFAYRWGGDKNQKIDFPVKAIMLGQNDSPDTFIGKGKIIFHKISFR